MERKKYGVGLLGTGWMGRVHSKGFMDARCMYWPKSRWDVELAGVCGTSPQKGQAFAERFMFRNYHASLDELLADKSVTVFDNVTPDHSHVEPTLAAIRAGKHVICEKPIALRVPEARRMWEDAERAGVKHLCCFSYRFLPAVRLAYDLIRDGKLGRLYHFAGTFYQDQGSFEETPVEKIWYVYGSGVDQGIGTHLIDMSRFLLGEDVTAVSGMKRTYITRRNSAKGVVDVDATEGFFAMLEYGGGVTGVMQCLGVANGKQSEFSVEIFGSGGGLRWDMADPNILWLYQSDTPSAKARGWMRINCTEPEHPFMDTWWPRGHVVGWENGHVNMLAHFLDCLAEDRDVAPLGATFKEGYEIASIIETIHRSAAEGRKLPVSY
ncbi:MAG: Gfo/Idh/MocA family oxidoreductase [Synergistaceae bacterium]|nr:Gfo/Idh/MocA family oxidoreductase [Synergistaceae bacterium]